jgi:hypothetical protein
VDLEKDEANDESDSDIMVVATNRGPRYWRFMAMIIGP